LITSPSRLLTIYLKTDHFIPQRGKKRLETIEKKEGEIEGESEEGEGVIWCEEIGKYGGVFIGGNGSIGYNYHKCRKKMCKLGKTCRLKVENLTTVQKTCVLELRLPTNLRELTCA